MHITEPTSYCQDSMPRRRQRRTQKLNGIDYIDVTLNDDGSATLDVFLFQSPQPEITAQNIRITGGQLIPGEQIAVTVFDPSPYGDHDACFRVIVSHAGDFTPYTLHLVTRDDNDDERDDERDLPMPGFDPRAAQISFSFMVDCPSDMDCVTDDSCPPETYIEPEISYLAKDYGSFRQLALDRLALLMPDWKERHVPDLGITLVEVLAYVGDYLSYYQDAVATEAYLHTARQRISVRRHARLVDYLMHEGCNARAWLCLKVTAAEMALDLRRVYFITDRGLTFSLHDVVAEESVLQDFVHRSAYEVFEPVMTGSDAVTLYQAHNRISFYTWGEKECCLPRGTTYATLRDDGLYLEAGDVLIFSEVIGPRTGNPADADPSHRHAVRLTRVSESYKDPVYEQAVVDIEWDSADALPFALCISAQTEDCAYIEDVSVACGNVILVDHGQTLPPECLGEVEGEDASVCCDDDCHQMPIRRPVRYRPQLGQRPLVFGEAVESAASAQAALYHRDPRAALPHVTLTHYADVPCEPKLPGDAGIGWAWTPRYDLLASGGDDRHYVVEMDNDGYAHLRFGDGDLGEQPTPGMTFWATYRVGESRAGNVGAETIRRMIVRDGIIDGVIDICNPLPAYGGQPPESISDVKLYAPSAFRQKLMRAITPEDYADLTRAYPGVQRAAARLMALGGRTEVLLVVDPLTTQTADAAFLEKVRQHLLPYRRIGHSLRVMLPDYVPLDVTLKICVKPAYIRSQVRGALLEVIGSGKSGFFHPDRLTFGTVIAFSQLVSAAQQVTGVESVDEVTIVARDVVYSWPQAVAFDPDEEGELSSDLPIIEFSPSEVPLLANDRNFPEHGMLTLLLKGGR